MTLYVEGPFETKYDSIYPPEDSAQIPQTRVRLPELAVCEFTVRRSMRRKSGARRPVTSRPRARLKASRLNTTGHNHAQHLCVFVVRPTGPASTNQAVGPSHAHHALAGGTLPPCIGVWSAVILQSFLVSLDQVRHACARAE